jgi:pimeloyl-ACP methyl ester carboxylesterase
MQSKGYLMGRYAKLCAVTAAVTLLGMVNGQAAESLSAQAGSVAYRTETVDGLAIAYREVGPKNAPTLLLFHGFPSSSRMFEPLFARLGRKVHMIAADYPGFGHSDAPDHKSFAYTFDHISQVMEHFIDQKGLKHYALYMEDYGGPMGFRVALWHPERVQGIIIQNTVAHDDGLGPSWAPRRAFWADRAAHETAFRQAFLSAETTRKRHIGSSPNLEAYDPDLWTDEFAFLSRPGEADLQSDLFYDWQTNVAAFPAWQDYLKTHRPATIVIWGRYDPSFDQAEAGAYRREVPTAEIHLIDAGHFAMDEQPDQVAALVGRFMAKIR